MNTKSPLKSLKLYAALLAVGYSFVCQPLAIADVRFDVLLKGEGDVYFFALDSRVGTDLAQENDRSTASRTPAESRGQREFPDAGFVNAANTVDRQKAIERTPINHGDLDLNAVARGYAAGAVYLVDGYATLPVEKTSEVNVVISHLPGSEQKVRELGGQPMPGPEKGAEGQYRTKHRGESPEGVRREQVRTPKGKVCSELGGNVENEMETVSSCMVFTIPYRVTESYMKTCNVPVRFVRPGGQGGQSDVTWESLEYMGRPWYFDRQCPAGRAYMLRPDDTYFKVDPRFLFKWTGDLTYPDQMAFTRLCGIRFFLQTDRRMFQAVLDGISA